MPAAEQHQPGGQLTAAALAIAFLVQGGAGKKMEPGGRKEAGNAIGTG